MSVQQPTQDGPQILDGEDPGKDQLLRTRYYCLIMTIMVVIGAIINIVIFIEIIMNAEGRVRVPCLVFVLPVVGALAISRFADAAPAKEPPHLVPGYAAPYFQGGQTPQQGQYEQPQYGQPVVQLTTPQSIGYGQVLGQQAAQNTPQQAPHSRPQQQGQVPPSGQYGQDSRNQQPHDQGGQPGQNGLVSY